MESSKSLTRIIRQIHCSKQGCLRVPAHAVNSASRFTNHRISTPESTTSLPASSPRGFCTSIGRLQDSNRPSAVDSPPQDAASTKSAATQAPSQQKQRQPPAIDLSSITSNPDYKPPPRPQAKPQPSKPGVDRDVVSSAISRLLQQEREALRQKDPSQRATYNSDVYGKGGTLSSRTTTPRPLDPSKLFSEIQYKSPKGGSSAANALTGDLSSEREDLSRSLRLTPSIGKSVTINLNSGFDLTRAFQVLETKINTRGNSVKNDMWTQMFHVRKGQKKKIERRKRWRIMFKAAFVAECARVRKMVRQGW